MTKNESILPKLEIGKCYLANGRRLILRVKAIAEKDFYPVTAELLEQPNLDYRETITLSECGRYNLDKVSLQDFYLPLTRYSKGDLNNEN